MTRAYNIDCMEAMREMEDNQFSISIVDPPYGINAGKMTMGSGRHKFTKDKSWDESIPSGDYFRELFRISENQIIWGGNYFTSFLRPTKHWLVWDKLNPNLSFAEGELAWQSVGTGLRIYKYYSATQDKIHPTQKPIDLYRWTLKNYAKEGDTILDTHLGSGSSRIAAHDMGFDFTGYEIDKDYFDAQELRFKHHTQQQSMFKPNEMYQP